MGDKSKIEWTDATWNPIVGCSVISPGCAHCYAMKFAGNRLEGNPHSPHYAGMTQKGKAGPVWTGNLALAPGHILTAPLRWKRPRTVFVNSMGDLFHEATPTEWIDQVFAVMLMAPQHTFQVLTKRADRMRDYMKQIIAGDRAIGKAATSIAPDRALDRVIGGYFVIPPGPWPNVWLGVSVEDQKRADERIPDLLETPAIVRFISAEPLLGPVGLQQAWFPQYVECEALGRVELPALSWVIAGGESGRHARPMHPVWARSLRDQCQAAGVPFFFKQWGAWRPLDDSEPQDLRQSVIALALDGTRYDTLARAGFGAHLMNVAGKMKADRRLDGRQHDEMPDIRRPAGQSSHRD